MLTVLGATALGLASPGAGAVAPPGGGGSLADYALVTSGQQDAAGRHPVHGKPGLTRKQWRWVSSTRTTLSYDRLGVELHAQASNTVAALLASAS